MMTRRMWKRKRTPAARWALRHPKGEARPATLGKESLDKVVNRTPPGPMINRVVSAVTKKTDTGVGGGGAGCKLPYLDVSCQFQAKKVPQLPSNLLGCLDKKWNMGKPQGHFRLIRFG